MTERVVIDTNVWISALLTPRGRSRAVIDRAAGRFVIAMSEQTMLELERKVASPKFAAAISADALDQLLEAIIAKVEFFVPLSAARRSRDPDDDAFLQLAAISGAKFLITGDADLLVLAAASASKGLSIVSPADFLARTETG